MPCTQVVFNASDVTVSELLKAVQDANFAAELLSKQEEESSRPEARKPPCCKHCMITPSSAARSATEHVTNVRCRLPGWRCWACTARHAPRQWSGH